MKTMMRLGVVVLLLLGAAIWSLRPVNRNLPLARSLQLPFAEETGNGSLIARSAANAEPHKETPDWAIPFGKEFWREASSIPNFQPSLASGQSFPPGINFGDIFGRLTHSFRAEEETATVRSRAYAVALDGSEIEFVPGNGREMVPLESPNLASTAFRMRLHSVQSGGTEITAESLSRDWNLRGNTAQSIVAPGLVEHVEARPEGVELTWVLREAPVGGDLRIEVAIGGMAFGGSSESGMHFEDENGTARVRVGQVIMKDSGGHQMTLPSQFEEGRWVVSVSADLLQTAVYPVAIDPLISPEFGMDHPVSAIAGGENPRVAGNGGDYLVVWLDWRNQSNSDIYAARVSRDGWVLDPDGIGVRVQGGGQQDFDVASDGKDYLVVWTQFSKEIFGARVSSAGQVLDPGAILVCQSPLFPNLPAVGSNGNGYLVAWNDNRNHSSEMYANVVTSDGRAGDTSGVLLGPALYNQRPAVAAHGTNYLVAWSMMGGISSQSITVQGTQILRQSLPNIETPADKPALASNRNGYLLAWESWVENKGSDIKAMVLGPDGVPIGSAVTVCSAAHDQLRPAVASDGDQFLVAWQDNRRGAGLELTNDVYAARVSTSGTVLDPNGVLLAGGSGNHVAPAVACNGGPFVVVWQDLIDGSYPSVWGMRITKDGTVLDPRGIPISLSRQNGQDAPAAASNGDTYLVAWADSRNGGSDVYGARVTLTGKILDPSGIELCIAPGAQSYIGVGSDGTGYLVAWSDQRHGIPWFPNDIYGTRVSADGAVQDRDGLPISLQPGHQYYPKIASDGSDYVVVWQHQEPGERYMDIYARAVKASGEPVLGEIIPLSEEAMGQWMPAIASNGQEYLVVWEDYRTSVGDIYGMRLSGSGAILGEGAFPICTEPRHQVAPLAASTQGDYFVVWLDGEQSRSNFAPYTLYGTRVSAAGAVSRPATFIAGLGIPWISRGLAADDENYLVTWIPANGTIQASRFNAQGELTPDHQFSLPRSGIARDATIAGSGSNFLVAYEAINGAADFPRVNARLVEFPLPAPWADASLGAVSVPGEARFEDGRFTIKGSGAQMSGANEGFHFVYQRLEGDGQITARLNSLEGDVAEAGLMIRENLGAGSKHVFIGFNGQGKAVFHRRERNSGAIRSSSAAASTPLWLKLIRAGELFVVYRSTDGQNWSRLDRTTIRMDRIAYVGLAVSAQSSTLAQAQFDRVFVWRFEGGEPLGRSVEVQPAALSPASALNLKLRLENDPGGELILETSSNLQSWTPLRTLEAGETESQVADPGAVNQPHRFYRVRSGAE